MTWVRIMLERVRSYRYNWENVKIAMNFVESKEALENRERGYYTSLWISNKWKIVLKIFDTYTLPGSFKVDNDEYLDPDNPLLKADGLRKAFEVFMEQQSGYHTFMCEVDEKALYLIKLLDKQKKNFTKEDLERMKTVEDIEKELALRLMLS